MELRVLKYFLMAAREENITKAARLLCVTQPTLSRQIMQLEEELGVKLFVRSKHNIILTDDGMLLKRRAEELVSLAEKTKREFSREEGNLTGEIAIGSGELRSVKFLAEILASFRKIHPLIRYELYSGNADQIKDRIEKGLLDVGLLLEPVDIGKYEFLRIPSQEEWGVLAKKDSDLAIKETVNPHDLKNVPLLIAGRELVRNELASWFGSYYDQLDIAATYNLLYNSAVMVQNGIGVALCLKLDSEYDNLCFVPLSPQLKACSVLAWKKN
ncbi:MAG: LysR family transcriptional regulator, partial [Synergistaceae bacterium]|nr:LysR family transcriptional regulator [Synergistaceae bacterium]